MFDSVLDRGQGPRSRFGTGTVISVVLHVGLFALAMWLANRPPPVDEVPVDVTFVTAAPPPPPPPPPAPATPTHVPKQQPKVKADKIVKSQEIVEKTPEPEVEQPPEEPTDDAPVTEGVEGGVPGGVVGGVVGGVLGGVVGGQLGGTGTDVVPFGEGMTRPVQTSGPPHPQYTREARVALVEGLMIVRCTVTLEGTLERCKVIKPLPHMESAVQAWASSARYKPATFQGRPIPVEFTFNFRLRLEN